MADTFRYGQLNPDTQEIRLLRVKTSGYSDPQRAIGHALETISSAHPLSRHGWEADNCLENYPLADPYDPDTMLPRNDPPDYYAISYVWGEDWQRTPINIDGQELMVPINTAKAVESVRAVFFKEQIDANQPNDILIWIDAICINQSDLDERAQQVSMMKQIYERAAGVVIWLGDHASQDQAKEALRSLHDFYDDYMHFGGGAIDPCVYPSDKYIGNRKDYLHRFGGLDRFISSLAPVYTSPWFGRVWTVQESGLARKAWCILEDSIIPLYEITVVASVLAGGLYYNVPGTLHDVASGLELAAARGTIKHLAKSGQFFPAIKAVMTYSATNARDMVYGVLGLVNQHCYPIPIVVDYSWPTQEVFARATMQSIILSGCLEPLQIAAAQSEIGGNGGFPSWVMRLDRGKKTMLVPLRPQFPTPKYGRWLSEIHDTPHRTGWKLLRLEGAIRDEVSQVIKLDCIPSRGDSSFSDKLFSVWSAVISADADVTTETSVISHDSPPPTLPFSPPLSAQSLSFAGITSGFTERDEARECSIARTLSAGLHAKDEDHAQGNVREMRKALRQAVLLHDRSESVQDWIVRKVLKYSFKTSKRIERAFFITKEGGMGMGPLTTLPGDQVCVLSGSRVPFVLRQRGLSWTLIGDAYLDRLDEEEPWSDLAIGASTDNEPQSQADIFETSPDADDRKAKATHIIGDGQSEVPYLLREFDIQ